MKDLYLIVKNLTRNPLRLTLNAFAILTAFLLFGVLDAVKGAFDAGVELSADNRLVVLNKINFTQPLPLAYVNKTRSVEGVDKVTHANWFGGYYQDPRNMAMSFAVDPESYLDVYEEIVIDEGERSAWFRERRGAVVGEALARKNGWKVGDTIPLSSNIFSKADGSHTWDIIVSGIFRGKDKQFDTNYLLFHYKYFIETQTFGSDWVGWLILTTQDPEINERVAKAIDTQFANSFRETETSTEKAFNKAFLEQMGSIGLILTSVVMAAFFTILMIVGNAMVLAVRERTREIAVMKTLGFSSTRIFRMVLGESIFLACIGGGLGLLFAQMSVDGISKTPQLSSMFPNLVITTESALTAVAYMLALGIITGLLPAYRAMKLNTIDALSRGR